jgi:hypothetical protein
MKFVIALASQACQSHESCLTVEALDCTALHCTLLKSRVASLGRYNEMLLVAWEFHRAWKSSL